MITSINFQKYYTMTARLERAGLREFAGGGRGNAAVTLFPRLSQLCGIALQLNYMVSLSLCLPQEINNLPLKLIHNFAIIFISTGRTKTSISYLSKW